MCVYAEEFETFNLILWNLINRSLFHFSFQVEKDGKRKLEC